MTLWAAVSTLWSPFHATRLVLAGMRARDFGRIINISSVYGLFGTVNRVDYVTTKTALIGFTRAVALETAAQDITCNAICPGTVPTPAIEERLAAFAAKEGLARDDAVKAFMASRQPSGRFVAPAGVATTLQPLHREPRSAPAMVIADPGATTRPGVFARGPTEMMAVAILQRAAAK